MTTVCSNNPDWNNISSIQFDDNVMSIKQENEEILLSVEIDQEQLQISSLNNSIQKSFLPDLVCGVCSAAATGYNFGQITCESCKAFFRRNALRHMPHRKCRFDGICIINIKTRRYCTYCRLKKCFDIQMRKDWIRTEEEKELRQLQKLAKEQKRLNKLTNAEQSLLHLRIVARKKKRLPMKPKIQDLVVKPIFRQTLFDYNRYLSHDDRTILNNINNAYQSIADQIDGFCINKCTPSSSLIEFFNGETKMHASLIWFYKSIPEFTKLHIEDQILLIKRNLINIVHLHYILVQNFQESPIIGLYMSKWINDDFHQRMSRTRRYFDRFMEHPLILKLALIVLIFNINISPPRDINQFDQYINELNIREIQDFYITILWRYLNYLFGERKAIQSIEIITTQILQFQSLVNIVEEHIRQKPDRNTFNHLFKSLFRLT